MCRQCGHLSNTSNLYLIRQVMKNKSLFTIGACTLCCPFVKTEKTPSRHRNIRPSQMERRKMQLRSGSFLFSIRRTLPVVHWFAVIISQTQTPASETWINSLHRYFSALPSENSNLTAFSVTLRGSGILWSLWISETIAGLPGFLLSRCRKKSLACGSGGFVVH